MQYKTIVLELLQERQELHDQLRKNRKLLATVNLYAGQLKTSHESWKAQLTQAKQGSDPSQVASEALEIALKELEERLPSRSPPNGDESISLDEAMTFLRRHTPPA